MTNESMSHDDVNPAAFSDLFPMQKETVFGIEEMINNFELIIDMGFCFEVYVNPDGVVPDEEGETTSNGASFFFHIAKPCTVASLLNEFSDQGCIRSGTLTLRVVGTNENPEYGFCLENPLHVGGNDNQFTCNI